MKNIFLIIISLFSSLILFSQNKNSTILKRHVLSVRAGYSFPVSSSQVGSPRSEIGKTYLILDKNNNITSEKNSFTSRGAGLNFGLSYDYMITENISIGMNFNYIRTLGIIDAYTLQLDGNDTLYYGIQTSYTSMFTATPMLGIYASKNLLIRPYAKFGLIIPFAGYTYANLLIDDRTSRSFHNLMPLIDRENYLKTLAIINSTGLDLEVATKTVIDAKSEGAFSIGFDARLGAEYLINDNMGLFFEMNMQMLTVKTKKTFITKFNSGVDESLGNLAQVIDPTLKINYNEEEIPEILRVTEYLDELNYDSNNSYDDAILDEAANLGEGLREKPLQELNFRNNYNAFGLLIGFKFSF